MSAPAVGVVTGAASGIGASTARRLARQGFAVVCCDINDDAGRSVADDVGATYVSLDVGDAAAWAERATRSNSRRSSSRRDTMTVMWLVRLLIR